MKRSLRLLFIEDSEDGCDLAADAAEEGRLRSGIQASGNRRGVDGYPLTAGLGRYFKRLPAADAAVKMEAAAESRDRNATAKALLELEHAVEVLRKVLPSPDEL